MNRDKRRTVEDAGGSGYPDRTPLRAVSTQDRDAFAGARSSAWVERWRWLRPSAMLAFVFLGAYLLISLFPIYWIIISSIKTRVDTLAMPPVWFFRPTFKAYLDVFVFESYGKYFFNTTVIALSTTTISLAVGSMAAYVMDRYRFRFSDLIAYSLLATRMIFPIVYAIPLFLLFRDLGLLDTHIGLIIAYTTFSLPYAVWIMSGFFAAVPREIDEAAMVDGCSRFGAYCRVILPLTAPGLAAATIFILLLSWNEFLFALVLAGGGKAKTLPVAAAQLIGQREIEWNALCAVSTATIVPLLAFFSLVHKYLLRGMIAGAVK
ncbi:MAG: carbohydrate ABC transporter permease [Chloroflexi bacterium]|nr:carbohydrate ABC transporter permease [Chloroflexota bacterium]